MTIHVCLDKILYTRLKVLMARFGNQSELLRRALGFALKNASDADVARNFDAQTTERLCVNVPNEMYKAIRVVLNRTGFSHHRYCFLAVQFSLKRMTPNDWLAEPAFPMLNGRGRNPKKDRPKGIRHAKPTSR